MTYSVVLVACAALLAVSLPYTYAQEEVEPTTPGPEVLPDWSEWWYPVDDGEGDGDCSGGGGDVSTPEPGPEPTTPVVGPVETTTVVEPPVARAGKKAHARSGHAHASRSGAHARSAKARAAPKARKSASRAAKAHRAHKA